jgi:hypothetical protein
MDPKTKAALIVWFQNQFLYTAAEACEAIEESTEEELELHMLEAGLI